MWPSSVSEELGSQREFVSRCKHDELALLGVFRLKARHREHHVAVAAGAGLALDVVEIRNHYLSLPGAAGAEDRHLPHDSMVARPPDGAWPSESECSGLEVQCLEPSQLPGGLFRQAIELEVRQVPRVGVFERPP